MRETGGAWDEQVQTACVTERDAALSLLRVRSVLRRQDVCGHELLFVSAATLINFFFHLHIVCISLLHFGVLSRVT